MAIQSTYTFQARDMHGKVIKGTMAAADANEVGARLRSEGKYVIQVSDHALTSTVTPRVDASEILRNESAKRISRDDIIAFAQQLGVMMETGVPLGEAIESFTRQQRNEDFQRVLHAVTEDLQAGEALSAALAKWPRVFPTIMISLMKASEASGTMASMLGRVGEYLAKERKTIKQIRGALSYPLFMLTLGLSITMFLVAFVLPRFAKIYEQRSASLPLPTSILMNVSNFLIGEFFTYMPVLVAAGIAFMFWRKSASGKRTLDWLRLNLPVLRRLFGQLYLARAARTMATLLHAGVGFLDMIEICRGVTRNVYWDRLWDETSRLVKNGQQVSDAFSNSRIIPSNVVSMITAGERSGRLDHVMERIADFSDEELDNAVRQTTAFIEPLMICIMGAIVGGVALALLLPIFTIGNVMSGQ